jgi:hypothetical protein
MKLNLLQIVGGILLIIYFYFIAKLFEKKQKKPMECQIEYENGRKVKGEKKFIIKDEI